MPTPYQNVPKWRLQFGFCAQYPYTPPPIRIDPPIAQSQFQPDPLLNHFTTINIQKDITQ